MAICHFSVGVISRASGASAVISAAYRHAAHMSSKTYGSTRDYSSKQDELRHAEVSLPEDAAEWARKAFGEEAFRAALVEYGDVGSGSGDDVIRTDNRVGDFSAWAAVSQSLWDSVEWHEQRVNRRSHKAQLARSLTIALPQELSGDDQVALLRGYIGAAFTSRGMIADWVVHDKGDGNPHAHVMLTMRDIGESGWGNKNRGWNDRGLLVEWRRTWADHVNLVLEREGFTQRIDHRSLADQGIELQAEGYNPHIASSANRRGVVAAEQLRCEAVVAANRDYLRSHPDHILVVVQAGRR